MGSMQSPLSPERRALLARKGQILYGKDCGKRGRGGCAESFALYQLGLGNVQVVHDLLGYLDSRLDMLRMHDPEGLMSVTERLATRIRQHLEDKS
jgi:hypothetical protein